MIIKNGVLEKVYRSDISKDGKIVIPDGVTKIEEYVFYCLPNLTSVTIPNGVTSIGRSAFGGCIGLTSITIPDSVTNIGSWAFSGCYRLTHIDIPDNVTKIENCAFWACLELTSVTIGKRVADIGENVFFKCIGLTSIAVAKGNPVYHSAGNCLINTKSKTLIAGCQNSVIPNDGTVTSIGDEAFAWCNLLTSINIPDGVTRIGDYAFGWCSGLTSITIPDGVMRIGHGAFYDIGLESAHKNYKAFHLRPNGSLVCRKREYSIGKKSVVKGTLELCERGIHYCTDLFEIFDYYFGEYGKDFVIAECEVSNEREGEQHSSKKCARWIIPQSILTREEVIQILNDGSKKR